MEYTIRRGDTLSELAHKYGTTVDQLVKMNGINNRNMIREGAKLFIPGAEGPNKASVMYNSGRFNAPAATPQQYVGPELRSWNGTNYPDSRQQTLDSMSASLAGPPSAVMGAAATPSAVRGLVGLYNHANDFFNHKGRYGTVPEQPMNSAMYPNPVRQFNDLHGQPFLPAEMPPLAPNPATTLMPNPARGAQVPPSSYEFNPGMTMDRGVPRYGGQSRVPPDISSMSMNNYMGQPRTVTDLERMLYGGGY